MTEYIDREKLIANLIESACHHVNNSREESLLYRDRNIVREQPTADVVERDKVKQAREEFISKYPKNYMGELELGGRTCYFSLNDVLAILDKLIESEE